MIFELVSLPFFCDSCGHNFEFTVQLGKDNQVNCPLCKCTATANVNENIKNRKENTWLGFTKPSNI